MAQSAFSRKVLVVDDDEFIRECCADVLTQGGYAVDAASNGMEALDRLDKTVYDLVLSDINMPRLDGITLYLTIEREHVYLKDRFLFMTSLPPEGQEVRTVLQRMRNRLLRKPFSMTELLKNVDILTIVPLEEQFAKRGARFPYAGDCYVNGRMPLPAKTEDISSNGMRIKYSGAPMPPGMRVNIKAGNMERRAEIVWSRSFKDFARAGLRLDEPMPLQAILERG
ncbi:MAG: response regulator [Deltaproteobacteria bacterium]|nr:response regulator [Deltaproteobacteria bacterium]